jgi:hypothetical protein
MPYAALETHLCLVCLLRWALVQDVGKTLLEL